MRLLFRDNASPGEKVFMVLALAWMLLAIYGMLSSILASLVAGLSKFVAAGWVETASFYLAVPLAVIVMAWLPAFLDPHLLNKLPTFGAYKRALVYLLILAVAYGVAWTGLALGGASLITRIVGEERTDEFKVVWKSSGRWKRRECDYALRLRSLTDEWETKVCVRQDFWQAVSPGQTLRARGRYSSFGAMIEELDQP